MGSSFLFRSPATVFSAAIILRIVFLVYGHFQDAFSPMKYTDIDYFVFTDAAHSISRGQSPYTRDTYRYTPLLAWFIYPTTWPGFWFSFGKVLFAVGDIVAGWMMFRILRSYQKMSTSRALKFASIWLLNPMVATISTRGSSEGLLGVIVTALLWSVLAKRIRLAGCLLGFAVHFKIYPFIYAASIVWWLDDDNKNEGKPRRLDTTNSLYERVRHLVNPERLTLAIYSLVTFMALNVVMYSIYGFPFLEHSYLYHLIRIDHRHNFSPYNTLLYLNSAPGTHSSASFKLERLAFVPQILLSAVMIPLALAKQDLPSAMLAQTFAFVTFNKVCTSQYFLWYMMFLPFYLPGSTLLRSRITGVAALVLWILGQAAWLQQGYQLEFLGNSTFVPGLWAASMLFFVVNVGILGIIIQDAQGKNSTPGKTPPVKKTS